MKEPGRNLKSPQSSSVSMRAEGGDDLQKGCSLSKAWITGRARGSLGPGSWGNLNSSPENSTLAP